MHSPDEFLATLRASQLLTTAELQAELAEAPTEALASADALAEFLSRRGKLSTYQARKLLLGASRGLILDRFQIVTPIGRGGSGTVYLARDSRDRQLVALKVLPPNKAQAERRLIARFRREMDLARRVDHPHITRTHDALVHDGIHFIVMEYIPGQNLFRVVRDHGPLAVAEAARIFADLADALDHAHDRGLVHRDLKPSNVMLTPAGQVKLLDLGLALELGEVVTDETVTGGKGYVVGSMDYIAPEQAENAAAVDARADLYGLGCTLYFALTGQPPFPGGDRKQKIHAHRKQPPPHVTALNPLVPVGLSAFIAQLMAKSPDDRPASAREVRDYLKTYAKSEADGRQTTAVEPSPAANEELQEIELPEPQPPARSVVNDGIDAVIDTVLEWPSWVWWSLLLLLLFAVGWLIAFARWR